MKILRCGTEKEKIPSDPGGSQWKALQWGRHNPHLPFLGSWQEPEWAIMSFDGHRCPVPHQGSCLENHEKSASCPLSFPGGGGLCQGLWCLSGLCRSVGWGHPGSRIPLIQWSLHPLPFVLLENDEWPSCFLRGWNSCWEAECQVQASVWLCMSFPAAGWGHRRRWLPQ